MPNMTTTTMMSALTATQDSLSILIAKIGENDSSQTNHTMFFRAGWVGLAYISDFGRYRSIELEQSLGRRPPAKTVCHAPSRGSKFAKAHERVMNGCSIQLAGTAIVRHRSDACTHVNLCS